MDTDKKLRRPRTGRQLEGVCAALADFFGLDATVVRVAYALLTCFTAFAGIPIYLILWLIIPEAENRK